MLVVMTESRQRLAWWMVGGGIVTLTLLNAITTGMWGLFVLCTLIAGVIAWRTRQTGT